MTEVQRQIIIDVLTEITRFDETGSDRPSRAEVAAHRHKQHRPTYHLVYLHFQTSLKNDFRLKLHHKKITNTSLIVFFTLSILLYCLHGSLSYLSNSSAFFLLILLITAAEGKRVMFLLMSICLCPLDCSKNLQMDFNKKIRGKHVPRNSQLVFGCDSYRQPRIKHENPRRRFELSEWFLVKFYFCSVR